MSIWNLPRVLDESEVERALARMSTRSPVTRLEVHRVQRAGLTGESRLLGFLAAIRAREIDLPVGLHTGARERGLPDSSKYWAFFSQTLIGVAISTFASSIRTQSREDVLPQIRAYQIEHDVGEVVSGGAITELVRDEPPRLGPGVAFAAVGANRRDKFREYTVELLERLNLPALDDDRFRDVLNLLWEVLRNTERHARMDRLPPQQGVRSFGARRIQPSNEATELLELAGSTNEYLTDYLRRIADRAARPALVAFSVSDSGPGIAATLSDDETITECDFERELLLTRRAFTREGTRDASRDPDAGLGLVRALDACAEFGGLVSVRSGRTLLQRHFLDSPSDRTLQHHGEPLAAIGGTNVTVVLPWPTST